MIKPHRIKKQPDLEAVFAQQLRALKIGGYKKEHIFHDTRKWRFDFAWIPQKIAVEIEGGTWSCRRPSRHTTAEGFNEDCHKYNEAALYGWTVLRGDSKMVNSLVLLSMLERALSLKSKEELMTEQKGGPLVREALKLKELADAALKEAERLEDKGVKVASTKFRKACQEMKNIAHGARGLALGIRKKLG